MDFLGTGQSDRLKDWPEDWWYHGACQAKALAEHLGQEKCIIMGTSGGAVAALLVAIHFPQNVTAVIADSCVEKFSPEQLRHGVEERNKCTDEQVYFWSTANGADWKQVVEADSENLIRLAENGGDCFQRRLKEIKCPVLLTGSLQDSFLPDIGGQLCRMSQQIEGSRVYICNSGDHPLMWSEADDFRRISSDFMRSLPAL
ncbi:MAG: hypothetical protein GY750_16730 [Lentisphaerae bacterium]|nr:hypothetical protein [Lentisphaerota bacterium]MCP4103043.1 hypothetical protein [Lentisphaerota bacterium]